MKTQDELRDELNRAYVAACEQKGIDSWTKFAQFVNIPYTTIYRMTSGKTKLTQPTIRRIYTELALKGVNLIGEGEVLIAQNNAQNISAPVTQTTTDDRWFGLCAEKDKQIDRLLGIIEKMQS